MVGLDASYSCIPACSIYYEPVLSRYTYDPGKANELLDAAGWKWDAKHEYRILPSGKPAALPIPYSEGATFREREVTIIEPMLKKIGIKVTHAPMDFDALLDSETAGTYDATLHSVTFPTFDISSVVTGWLSTEIPTLANGWQGQNVQRYSNARMDVIINEIKLTRDTTRLKVLYHEFQTIWAEDVPNIFLEQRMYPDVVNRLLKGFDHTFAGTVYYNWNAAWWYWKA
jgi:peptide/nickel transport system substrate-binding protein